MIKLVWMILFSAALFLFGCGTGDDTETQIKTEVIDGVKYIRNPAEPLHPEKTVQFTKELNIHPEDEEGNVFFFSPAYFLVDDIGNMYIADAQDQKFKVFNSEGIYIKPIGTQGGGPGEFQRLGFGGISPAGHILAVDFIAKRFSLFDHSGRFVNDFKYTQNFSGIHLVKNESFLVEEYVYGKDRFDHHLFIKEIDFEGNELRSYGEFASPEVKPVSFGDITVGTPVPHAPFSVFACDPQKGWLYHCLNSKFRIEVFNSEGTLFQVIERPYKTLPFTAEEKQNYRDRYKDYPSLEMRKAVNNMEMPNVKTVTDKMLVDGSGSLWVITHETKESNGHSLTAADIFDAEGRYVSRVWLQKIPQILKGGKMYRLETDDETGYTSLVRYSVHWK